jgi:hypothetical protein
MLNLPNLDPALANAAYIELRDCVGWLFADDSADTLALRRLALGRIEELCPGNAIEASLATQAVALDLHGKDSLRLATVHRDEAKLAVQCRNQGTAMARQALRVQAKLEALRQARRLNSVTWDAATGTFVAADQATRTPEQSARMPEQSEQYAPDVTRLDIGTPSLEPAAPESAEMDPDARIAADLSPEVLAKAEQFATNNRVLAMRIRHAGGLTRQAVAGFRPSALPQDDETLQALVFGRSPILIALDGGNGKYNAA